MPNLDSKIATMHARVSLYDQMSGYGEADISADGSFSKFLIPEGKRPKKLYHGSII